MWVLPRRLGAQVAWILLVVLAAGFLLWRPGEVAENYRPVTAVAQIHGDLRPIYSFAAKDKVATLTFDISWGETVAPKVLDVLKSQGVKATFFLSGPWAERHADLVRRIQAEGHEVQSHGQRHDNFSTLSRDGVARNILAAHKILADITGQAPNLARPPNGDFDATALAAIRDAGYRAVMWSVDSLDWKEPAVGAIVDRTLHLLHPGAVILMHASDSAQQTPAALPAILDGLKAQGYRLALLTEMLTLYPVDPAGFIHSPRQR